MELFDFLALGWVPVLMVQKEGKTEVGVIIELLERTESSLYVISHRRLLG